MVYPIAALADPQVAVATMTKTMMAMTLCQKHHPDLMACLGRGNSKMNPGETSRTREEKVPEERIQSQQILQHVELSGYR